MEKRSAPLPPTAKRAAWTSAFALSQVVVDAMWQTVVSPAVSAINGTGLSSAGQYLFLK